MECIVVKKFTLFLLCFIFLALPASSYNINHFTDDDKIAEALAVLKNNSANEIFDNLAENSVKIIFYDLSLLSYSYRNHYAINGMNSIGDRMILINTKYYKCSAEEIACLIAHESCHKAKVATLAEETTATETEAKYWIRLKKPKKTYLQTDLLERLDDLAALYKESSPNDNKIQEQIADSEFYRKQLSIE